MASLTAWAAQAPSAISFAARLHRAGVGRSLERSTTLCGPVRWPCSSATERRGALVRAERRWTSTSLQAAPYLLLVGGVDIGQTRPREQPEDLLLARVPAMPRSARRSPSLPASPLPRRSTSVLSASAVLVPIVDERLDEQRLVRRGRAGVATSPGATCPPAHLDHAVQGELEQQSPPSTVWRVRRR